MADPVLIDGIRMLAVFEADSGLPEDRIVNSWAFRREPPTTFLSAITTIAGNIDEFYTGSGGGAPFSPLYGDWGSAWLSGMWSMRFYDLSTAVPRIPVIIPGTTFVPDPLPPYPSEVALALSIVAQRNQPRMRGRLFLGPFKQGAGTSTPPRPGATLIADVSANAAQLLNNSQSSTEWDWCVLSQADADLKVITGGWVDDAWDTIRSRGVASSSRDTYGSFTS